MPSNETKDKKFVFKLSCVLWSLLFVVIIIAIFFTFFSKKFINVRTVEDKSFSQSADCKILAAKYDGKIFPVSSSDKLRGEVGFKIDKQTCAYEITWHTLFESDKIVKNVVGANAPNTSYDYVADVVFAKEGSNPLDGNIDPIFNNIDKLPTDAFNVRVPFDFYLTKELVAGTDKTSSTKNFHHVFQSSGTFSQSTVDDVLGVKSIKIYSRATGLSAAPVAEFGVNVSASF